MRAAQEEEGEAGRVSDRPPDEAEGVAGDPVREGLLDRRGDHAGSLLGDGLGRFVWKVF